MYIPDLLLLGVLPDPQQLLVNETVLLLHDFKDGHKCILVLGEIGLVEEQVLQLQTNILNNMPHELSQQFFLLLAQLLGLLYGQFPDRRPRDHVGVGYFILTDDCLRFSYLIRTQFYCLADLQKMFRFRVVAAAQKLIALFA